MLVLIIFLMTVFLQNILLLSSTFTVFCTELISCCCFSITYFLQLPGPFALFSEYQILLIADLHIFINKFTMLPRKDSVSENSRDWRLIGTKLWQPSWAFLSQMSYIFLAGVWPIYKEIHLDSVLVSWMLHLQIMVIDSEQKRYNMLSCLLWTE